MHMWILEGQARLKMNLTVGLLVGDTVMRGENRGGRAITRPLRRFFI